ncbi:hypothetical protein BC834DRAFT_875782 [Gloeopeniophorella convolvens]|nr:hypothetical protein BC834DRAFT_875782 [Gloeopeniophorella convolvens]
MPPDGDHVWLILYESPSNLPGFYLDLDVTLVRTLCYKPIKYLKYLACCILGLRGEVYLDGVHVSDEAELREKSLYLFRPDAAGDPQWIQLIIRSRTPDSLHDDDVQDLTSINDIRNGMSVNANIHKQLGRRKHAVLATPNHYLATEDVPCTERLFHPEVAHPDRERYTFQCLVPIQPFARAGGTPPDTDAAFHQKDELPSKLLLAYAYGATAMERWGSNWEKFLSKEARPDLERPAVQVPNVGFSRTFDGCSGTFKREANAGSAEGEVAEGYDAMDLVAYFWYNTPAARECRAQFKQTFQEKIDSWRSGVT